MSAYEDILAAAPHTTVAGNQIAAKEYVIKLSAFLSGESLSRLSDSQRNYLYKLRTKWEVRAKGKDERWNECGTRPGARRKGKMPASRKSAIDPTTYGSDEDLDPLLASLMRKYGPGGSRLRKEGS